MKEVLTNEFRWAVYPEGCKLQQKRRNKTGDEEWINLPEVRMNKLEMNPFKKK